MAINTHSCVLKEETLPSLGLLGGFAIEVFVLQKPGGPARCCTPSPMQPVPASPPEPPSAAASLVDLMNGSAAPETQQK